MPEDLRQVYQADYVFIVRSNDEFDWILRLTHLPDNDDVPYKGRIAEGTFRRVRNL